MRRRFALLLVAIAISICSAFTVSAQVAMPSPSNAAPVQELPSPLSPEAVREMVARMSDDQVRAMLLDRLDAVADAAQTEVSASETFASNIAGIWRAFTVPIMSAIGSLPLLVSKQFEAIGNFAGSFGAGGVFGLLGLTAAALAAGYAMERLVLELFKRWRSQPIIPDNSSLVASLKYLFTRLWREIFGLVVFYAVVRTVGRFLLTPDQIAVVAPFVLYLIMVPRLTACLSHFALAPNQPELRLLKVDDRWARYFQRHFVGLALLAGFGLFIIGFNTQFDVQMNETRIGFWVNLAVHLYIISIVWRGREGLVQMMLGSDADRTATEESVARLYPYFAIAVSAFVWVLATVVGGFGHIQLLLKTPHYTTMFWLLMAPLIDTAIRGLVRHLQPPMIGEGKIAEQAYRANRRTLIRVGRVLAFGVILLIIASAWELDLANVGSSSEGERFAGNIVEFLVIAVIGYILFECISLWVNRRLARERSAAVTTDQAAGEGGGAGGSRIATVLPLLLATAQIAIAVVFGLLAVGSLGIDTTPLLAGAGILGLAIGFGAQKLVTDIVSGIFFLVDDAFRVGEYVDVGGTMGTVEKIAIRSMQLRHHRGNVHTIPYGSVEKVTNFSRDWVIMKLMFTVPFETDPNKVKKIFKKIGAEMLEDPLFKDDFLEPFKSQGVFQFDDVGIVMRGKFMAKPGTQFTIRKEIYNRVRKEFDENGIEFARREVRVAIPGMEDHHDLNVEQQAAIEGAASGAVQAQIEKEAAALAETKK